MSNRPIAVTGMSINTPIGDTLDGFAANLWAGQSALSHWKAFPIDNVYSKVGADLSAYPVAEKSAGWEGQLPAEMHRRLKRLLARVPWSTQISLLATADAWHDARLADADIDPACTCAVVAGHNINSRYVHENQVQFQDEPDLMDAMFSLHSLDTDHAGCVSELLQLHGPIYTMGAACASGNVALRNAVDEIRHHGQQLAFVVASALDFSPVDVHAMALMGSISFESFNDEPARASRPFDVRREGFVPAHGTAVLVLEDLEAARRRGARIHAEVLSVAASSDGNHLPEPSQAGQVCAMKWALRDAGIEPEQIDYVSAHATSTPLGDLTEVRSIKEVFGGHAGKLKINATKSMLGHTCWAAPTVEAVAAILQMKAGRLHPSINVDELDPQVDLDICRGGAVTHPVRYLMKNSFGFGGINCVSIFKRHD